MLDRREFAFLLLFAAAILGAFLWPPAGPRPRSSLPPTANIENAGPDTDITGVVPRDSLPATADIEAADPDTDLTGVVVDSHGRPIAGALITSDIHTFGRAPLYSPDWTRPEVEGPTAVTARDGTFVLPVGHGEIVDLCVRPQEHGEAMVAWRRPGDHLRIEVTDGADLTVTVRNAAGEPVPDVRVFILSLQGFENYVHWHSGVTNRQGRYSYLGLTAGLVTVSAEKDDVGFAFSMVSIPASGQVLADLRLRGSTSDPAPPDSGDRATGRVLGPDGSALAGVRVATACDSAWTGASGAFAIRFEDEAGIAIWAPGFGRIVEEVRGWKGTREFRLAPGQSLSGSLVDPQGRPIPEAEVYLFPVDSEAAEIARTDARGTFRFADVAPAGYRLLLPRHPDGRAVKAVVVPAGKDLKGVVLRQVR